MLEKHLPSSFSAILMIGAVWGLAEAALGVGLKACASSISGSVMTAVALFFISSAWVLSRRIINLVWLLIIVSLIKIFDAWLLSLPIRHGAVANPIFAFWTECLAFVLMIGVIKTRLLEKKTGQAILGGLSALVAVNLFPFVKYATGIPACVLPGTGYPLSLYYAPLAVGASIVTVPLAFLLSEKVLAAETKPEAFLQTRAFRRLASPATLAICLLLIVLLRLAK
ncbi:MAG: hypothetical protein ACUVV5_02445 [Candidatus Aminicenantales bacterium]